MRFEKLHSNRVNWRSQWRFRSPFSTESCVTGNAEAGRTSVHSCWYSLDDSRWSPLSMYTYWERGWVHAIHTVQVDPHCWWQLQTWLPSTRLDGVIYVTDACEEFYQEPCTEPTTISNITTGIMINRRAELKIHELWSHIVWQLRTGSSLNSVSSKVATRYNSLQLLYIITFSTWFNNWIGLLWGSRAICANSILFRQTSQWKLIANERIQMCPYNALQRLFLEMQWRWL